MSLESMNAFAAALDKQMLLPILKFAAANDESDKLRQDYSTAADQINAAAQAASSAGVVEKAWAAVGPLKDMYFTAPEDGPVAVKFVGKEYAEAVYGGKFGTSELASNKVKDKHISALHNLAFALVDAGQIKIANDVLMVYATLTKNMPPGPREAELARIGSSHWGQYLCHVLLGQKDLPGNRGPRVDLDSMLSSLNSFPADKGNTARSTLLHWSLFHFFKQRSTTGLLDLLFFTDKFDRSKSQLYANVVQCLAPHLLRYVAVAAVLGKKKRTHVRRAARLLDAEAYQYSDEATRFVVELVVNTNFAAAASLIPKCAEVLRRDYFCVDLVEDFVGAARQLVFEDQLRVRKALAIATVGDQLGMSAEKAELWLVELIREAKLNATVDSVSGMIRVHEASNQKSVWQYTLERLEAIDRPATTSSSSN